MRTLREIAEDMETWTGQNQDIEVAHSRADDLLVEALRLAGTTSGFPQDDLDSLLDAYERVDKWYA